MNIQKSSLKYLSTISERPKKVAQKTRFNMIKMAEIGSDMSRRLIENVVKKYPNVSQNLLKYNTKGASFS